MHGNVFHGRAMPENPTDPQGDASIVNPEPEPATTGWIRRIYDWTLAWAHKPGGTMALFLIALVESSVFPIPPDVLLLALCAGAPKKSLKFAAVCTVGSVLGGILGYAIGYFGYDTVGKWIIDAYHGEHVIEKIQGWYAEYGFLGILLAAITPIPYKVFTIASGFFKYSFLQFVVASILGRAFRFFVEGIVLYHYGAKVRAWVERYFNLLSWAFMALLILGFVALKYLK